MATLNSTKKEDPEMSSIFDTSLIQLTLEHVNGIDSMVKVGDKIYLGLSCMPPKYLLASYNLLNGAIEDCGVRFNSNKLHNALVSKQDGKMYGGTWSWIKVSDKDCCYSDFEGGHLFCYDPHTKTTEDFGALYDHEQIFALVIDPAEEVLYGITYPLKRFFSFNIKTNEFNDITEIKGALGDMTSHQIVCDHDGNVWGSQGNGYFFKYQAKAGKYTETSIRLPEGEFNIDYIIRDDQTNMLYGGTAQSALFFSFDPFKENLRIIGKAGPQFRMPALGIDRDGIILGATGSTEVSCFLYDPKTNQLKDLGLIRDESKDITAYRMHSMVIDKEGNLYFGESDRLPYLFICKRKG
jgi:hypothetical protein